MISLLKLHFSYLFSWKIIYISLIIILINMISVIVLSKFYIDHNLLVFYSDYYEEEYMFGSMALIKIMILMQSMFLVINGFVINKYDVFIILRKNRKSVLMSKIFVLVISISTFTLFLYLVMNIVGLFLTPYYHFSSEYLYLFIDLLVFGIVYLLLYILLIIIYKNMYVLLIILIIYFVNNISLEYLVLKSDLSLFSKVINLVIPDIGYYKNIGHDLYYSNIYYLAFCLVLLEIILVIYNKSDITN